MPLLPLYVVKGSGTSLLGCDWLKFFKLDWKEICTLHHPSKLDKILKKYTQVFDSGLGTFDGISVDIDTYPQVAPKFFKDQYLSSIETKLKRNLID